MLKVNPNKLLHAKRIHFADGSKLENKTFYIISGFLVVDPEADGLLPTWHSVGQIKALEQVEQWKPPQTEEKPRTPNGRKAENIGGVIWYG